jgi:SAM-dependent methyltransferase
MDRRKRLLGDLDLAHSTGLEIGPRHAPLVARTEGPVKYVDYTDTQSLRAAQFDPSIDVDKIVDVDIVWGERRLREAAGGEVDYVVASHVIEHVPDLIGWLHELREVLKPGGVLGLAVPDRRFTFDVLRRETDLAEVVEAYLTQSRRPSIRQVFDAASASAEVDVGAAWRGELAADPEAPLKGAPGALRLARSLKENPRYLVPGLGRGPVPAGAVPLRGGGLLPVGDRRHRVPNQAAGPGGRARRGRGLYPAGAGDPGRRGPAADAADARRAGT